MKIFISCSGPISKEAAQTLREILPCMLQGLEIFVSQHDIESGTRWQQQLAVALEGASFGILCLTPSNQTSPWLLFEAGALTKHLEGRACALLLQKLSPAEITGPLSQFQHREFSKQGVLTLVRDINKAAESPLSEVQVERVFEKWWPDLESAYRKHIGAVAKVDAPKKRTDREMLEEILLRLRSLQLEGKAPAEPLTRIGPTTKGEELRQVAEAVLTSAQLQLLLALARAKYEQNPQVVDELVKNADEDDVNALVDHGFVYRTSAGETRMWSVVSTVLGRTGKGDRA